MKVHLWNYHANVQILTGVVPRTGKDSPMHLIWDCREGYLASVSDNFEVALREVKYLLSGEDVEAIQFRSLKICRTCEVAPSVYDGIVKDWKRVVKGTQSDPDNITTFELDEYTIANLRSAIEAIGYPCEEGDTYNGPLSALDTGDWLGMLYNVLPEVDHKPNSTPQELRVSAKNRAERC